MTIIKIERVKFFDERCWRVDWNHRWCINRWFIVAFYLAWYRNWRNP